MKLLSRTDRKLEKLGFKKVYESEIVAEYERYEIECGYTQLQDICCKKYGNHLIISHQSGIKADGFSLTYQEVKLVMKKYRELKRRYWRTKDAIIS